MTKPKPRAATLADAVAQALHAEAERRPDGLKPIEIVKEGIGAYLAYAHKADKALDASHARAESEDRKGLKRGTKSAIDRMLFNVNYWRAAYEDRITEALQTAASAQDCLHAISVWTSHPLKLNTLSMAEATATFERFCLPFAVNHRRGASRSRGSGPLPALEEAISAVMRQTPEEDAAKLSSLTEAMGAEAAAYDRLRNASTLEALFDVLPAWCLQGRIELVSGPWWESCDVMNIIIDELHKRFVELGFGSSACQYFLDSCNEALDAYHRDVTSEPTSFASMEVPELLTVLRDARQAAPSFEADGYGNGLPSWLISKEQLVWNILACSFYGPSSARPLLADSPQLLLSEGFPSETDVISKLAHASFERYAADRALDSIAPEFTAFQHLPSTLRDSSIAYICSIHDKVATLGYEVLPRSACYPERQVLALSTSEVECLAILEHRRWLKEREGSGWQYGPEKNVEKKRSPYLVSWEELPDCAREWNRSAVRSIPRLLDSVGLVIAQ